MANDLGAWAKPATGAFLVALGAPLTVAAPVFGFSYTQPDMGLLVIIFVVPVLWVGGVIFSCLAVAFGSARWQRVGGVTLLSFAGVELLVLVATIVVGLFSGSTFLGG